MAVNIVLRTKKYRLSQKKIQEYTLDILHRCDVENAELNIMLVGNAYIRTLNKKYKKRDSSTDVLAFRLDDEYNTCSSEKKLIGEIVISLDQAKKQARMYGVSFEKELCLYVIHGILHLLGYDDIKPKDRIIMERKQFELLTSLWRKRKK